MSTLPAPRYISTVLAANKVNMAVLFKPTHRCGSTDETCSCRFCSEVRSNAISPRMAQLMVESCDRIIDLYQLNQDGLVAELRDRLPGMVSDQGRAFFFRFVACVVALKESLEMGRPPRPNSTGAEIALHMILNDVSVSILAAGGAEQAIENAELIAYLPACEHDGAVAMVRRFLFEDQWALLLWKDDLIVRDIPRRTDPRRDLNWVPSFWFMSYTNDRKAPEPAETNMHGRDKAIEATSTERPTKPSRWKFGR